MSAGTILFITYIVAPVVVVLGLFGYLAHSEAKRYYAALEAQVISKDEMQQFERQLKKDAAKYRQLDRRAQLFKILGIVAIVITIHQVFAIIGAILAAIVFTLARRNQQASLEAEAKYFNGKELPKVAATTWTFRHNLAKYHWLMGMALSIAALLFSFATFIK
ncbi:hypothetical protein EQG49_08215 [Periweissella cryptocerci]|uniref:Uncharacterized protein n=1 Tax=Periweissella cryptocerci TaxID=2506420 RepID=A0A4P6YUJ1_9LACO|nr:hypothetical protein [Periweissella cryptocerci]QBO36454.1 hypothetical protein EQG49_08215 [Periweissella cryptocerci]